MTVYGLTVHYCIGAPYKAPGPREFASGDYVKVELDEGAFSAALQSGNSLDTIMVLIILDTSWAKINDNTTMNINF